MNDSVPSTRRMVDAALWALLATCIVRLWLMPLPSSFWIDEIATAFVVHFGAHHWSFACAPQVPASIYYYLPRSAEALLGFSEVVYRIPSIVVSLASLFIVSRLAVRLINAEAAWPAVFFCFSLKGFNYEAGDARPYALGIFVTLATVYLLVRWLDSGLWLYALGFLISGSLLWRVHLLLWPVYLLLGAYLLVRLCSGDTKVGWWQAGTVVLLLSLALAPVLLQALSLMHQAASHVVVPVPKAIQLIRTLKVPFILCCGAATIVLSLVWRQKGMSTRPSLSSAVLILGLWLVHPLALFAFSGITGTSVFLPRYLSMTLPGIALAAAAIATYFLSSKTVRPVTALFALGVLVLFGNWRDVWPPHQTSDWRNAALQINKLNLGADTPILLPSPFIEAVTPTWTPDYPLPSFLYCHLTVYPVRGLPYPFPFQSSVEAQANAARLASGALPAAGRFVIYGGDWNVRMWRRWFQQQPNLQGWESRRLGPFGDVDAVLFKR
jgi:Dolichyl-phosphate-mannose-protein mannosyltransferase